MVTGYTYNTYVAQLANLAVVDATDTNFLAGLPSVIDSAELRIMQDLDLLSTVSALTGTQMVANTNVITFPISSFITLQGINVLTPAGTSVPANGTRNPLFPTSKEELYFTYPAFLSGTVAAGVPNRFAMISQNQVVVGPWPDSAYYMEVLATVRPTSLSASNTTTFISLYLPDLFMAASMIYISGYQRNFGRAGVADDPEMSMTWQKFYNDRMAASLREEARKKFWADGWTSRSLAPTATPSVGQYPAARQ